MAKFAFLNSGRVIGTFGVVPNLLVFFAEDSHLEFGIFPNLKRHQQVVPH
jgi:hypothetical protein